MYFKGEIFLKKVFSFCLCILFASYLCVGISIKSFAEEMWLNAPIIKSLDMIKNPTDPDQGDAFTKDSYPFTITFTFDDVTLANFSYDTVALLEDCSFYPAPKTGEYSAFYDFENKIFTFYNMLYNGENRTFIITIADKGLFQTVKFNIGQVVPEPENPSSPIESSSSKIESSKAESSSKSSSSKESSSKTSSSKSSSVKASSLPASLSPHILVSSYTYDKNIVSDVPFTVTMEIINSSSYLSAEEIIITFDQSKDINDISVIGQTNIKYIPFLGYGEKQVIDITCVSKDISKDIIQNLKVDITFEYYDVDGEDPIKGKDQAILNFSTKENHTIRVERIQLSDEVYLNEIFLLKFRIVNLGLSNVKNADISITNEQGDEISRTFIGSIEASKAITEPEIPLQFNSLGWHNLIFTVYFSENQEIKSVSSPFTIFISEAPLEESSSEDSSSEESSSKSPAIIVEKSENKIEDSLVLGMFAAIIIVTISYIIYLAYKSISNKKNTELSRNNTNKTTDNVPESLLNDLKNQSQTNK